MAECKHKVLVLLSDGPTKLRCKHCHLTISEEELGGGYCPECYEEQGARRYDFEPVEESKGQTIRYQCETCQLLVECPAF